MAAEDRPLMLITGGSRGIGAATAVCAAEAGFDVAFSYVSASSAAANVEKDVAALGARVLAVRADVADDHAVVNMFEQIDATFGRIDALVNNAGIVGHASRVDALSPQRIANMFSINVFGSFACAREAVQRMSTARGGRGGAIINVSSRAAVLGGPGEYVDYAATKGAMDAMTIGLSKEVAAEGIRVNAVRPGLIYTDIHASGGNPDRVDAMSSGVPMQRGGTAREVADAIVWLAGEGSTYVTGSFVDVSGGR